MCHQILFSAIFQNQLLSHFICPFSYIIPHTRCILVNVLEVLHFCIATDVLRCTFHPSDIFNIILVFFFLYHLLQHKIFSLPWTPSNICLFWILLFYQNCPSFHCLSETTSSCCYLMEKNKDLSATLQMELNCGQVASLHDASFSSGNEDINSNYAIWFSSPF